MLEAGSKSHQPVGTMENQISESWKSCSGVQLLVPEPWRSHKHGCRRGAVPLMLGTLVCLLALSLRQNAAPGGQTCLSHCHCSAQAPRTLPGYIGSQLVCGERTKEINLIWHQSYFFRCRNLYPCEVQPSDRRWLFSSRAVGAACFKFSEIFLLAAGNLRCLWSTWCFASKKRFWSCWKCKNWFIWAMIQFECTFSLFFRDQKSGK